MCKIVCEIYRKKVVESTHPDLYINCTQRAFLTKIQNHICEKTRKKIVLLSFKKFVKTQFLGVVEFPSIF